MKRVQAKNRIDPKLVARFWPPALETFAVGCLRSAQITCLLGSAVALLDYFHTWQGNDPRWLPFALFGVHLLSFYRGLWLEENFRPSHWRVGVAELMAIFAGTWALLLFFDPNKLTGQEFLLNFTLAVIAWQLGRTWVRYYFYLFLQPDEVPEEEGGIPVLPHRGRPPYTHLAAYHEIKNFWYWLLAGQLALLLLALLVQASRKNDIFSAELVQNVALLSTAHLFLGIPLIGWARLRYLRTGWQLNRLQEPLRFIPRWNFYLLALIVLAIFPSMLIALVAVSNLLPFTKLSIQLPALPALEQPVRPDVQRPTGEEGQQQPAPWDIMGFVALIGMLLSVLLVGGIMLYAVWLLIKAGLATPYWQKLHLKELWQSFRDWMYELIRGRSKAVVAGVARPKPSGQGFLGIFRRERLPDDPRGQVQFHYRHMAQRAGKAGLPRRTGQTPEEYADYLSPTLDDPALTPDLADLTGLYEEARYSSHPIAPDQAGEARQHSDKLSAFFKQKSRRARNKEQ